VAAAWTGRRHTLKAPRAARTARGGQIGDLREIFKKYKFPFFSYFCTGWTLALDDLAPLDAGGLVQVALLRPAAAGSRFAAPRGITGNQQMGQLWICGTVPYIPYPRARD